GVIHRDIKPGNILVDRLGISKILDMGLARFYHSDDDMLTKKYDEKSVLGTADYVAPEQTINSHDVDVRADIYSLGATFYYILAGRGPGRSRRGPSRRSSSPTRPASRCPSGTSGRRSHPGLRPCSSG